MAGGTSGKSSALLMVAQAKLDAASRAVQQLIQNGAPAGDSKHAVSDPAIVAAIAALQAIQ